MGTAGLPGPVLIIAPTLSAARRSLGLGVSAPGTVSPDMPPGGPSVEPREVPTGPDAPLASLPVPQPGSASFGGGYCPDRRMGASNFR